MRLCNQLAQPYSVLNEQHSAAAAMRRGAAAAKTQLLSDVVQDLFGLKKILVKL